MCIVPKPPFIGSEKIHEKNGDGGRVGSIGHIGAIPNVFQKQGLGSAKALLLKYVLYKFNEGESVDFDELGEAIQNEDLYVDNPQFHALAFSYAAHRRKRLLIRDGDNLNRACLEEYDEISRRLDKTQFQEGCAVRNVLKTRRLAALLIDDKGELNTSALPGLIRTMKNSLYSLGPNRQHDSIRQKHILNVLILLNERVELVRILKGIDKPISHRYADQIIRDTLCLPAATPITDAHARRAVLSAWMCFLRQSVGSCFATAPAIIIQSEQPELFLKDIRDLLNTGRLKRTFGGIEYSVPLSSSWGAGDLKKPMVVPKGENFEQSGLWLSPGLAAAFEAAELLDFDDAATTKIGKIKRMLADLFASPNKDASHTITTPEEIIGKILLQKLEITQKDLENYDNRSVGTIHGGMFFQPVAAGLSNMDGKKRNRNKNELCALYHERLIAAGNALKGLSDNALLKAWEFSIASFAETKAQFTRWNLYSSLGLGAHERGGIGTTIYSKVKEKVEAANARVQEFQIEYEMAYSQIKTMESRIKHLSSEKEAQWLRAEYQSKRNEFYTLEEIRDKLNRKAHQLSNLYEILIEQYDALFPKYFQEVYDADMHDIASGQYDDSPAGFRLLFKYGRQNTSQWTLIHTPAEFIEALVSFFIATEVEIAALDELQGLQLDLSEIITSVVALVRTEEFLETAFYRMAEVHHSKIVKDPLNHLDKIDKKPWAYTSGGTMDTLVSCYYKLDHKPTEVGRWVESPMELLTFLIDSIKLLPPKTLEAYLSDPNKSMLIHSPTHAFLLKPGALPFASEWHRDLLTYIWARDTFLNPQVNFLESLWFDEAKMGYLLDKIAETLPPEYRYYFIQGFSHIHGNMRPSEFRDYILDEMNRERGLRMVSRNLPADAIDSLLYRELPIFPAADLRGHVEAIYNEIPSLDRDTRDILMRVFDMTAKSRGSVGILNAETLQSICKGILTLALDTTSTPIDYHLEINKAAQKLSFAMPPPIIFADTNWVKDNFAFVVNPGTTQLELWRVDAIGRSGSPMSAWTQWLDGTRRDRTWGVYIKPYEYSI